ncbi:lysophospholipase L1-like esterase [Comamonas sp. BIGb0124]|uniref:GDSL-type esterase/lipase family protein n=1 Tax=Comamonas sp. BIGb0124 TaxID=2485130 RepID=UPI000F9292B9|nr:GDSL-type esterase/lipase family protein [Comamonas sp. BIGb0124]ROR22724.1 lysophospholipase L1-like esterase [Comamonas sp. BIGb0124]
MRHFLSSPSILPAQRPTRRQLLAGGLLLTTLAACGRAQAPAPLPANARVLALGDSLTAGQGAPREQSWPARLQALSGWRVTNAGRNGDTSSGALARLPGLLADTRYDAILIGIGGNDMLHSVPREQTLANLRAMLALARQHTRHVALLATPQPDIWRASMGQLQDAPFYAEIASESGVLPIPDVYSRTLSQPRLRADQIHANAQGYAEIAQALYEALGAAGWHP